MPYKSKTPCCWPGCGATTHSRYCDKHTKQHRREYDQHRATYNPEHHQFYNGARWRKVRAIQLHKQPLCEHCLENNRVTLANVVDHKTPRSQGGSDYDSNNLQSLCTRCHNSKTAKETWHDN